MIEKLCMSCHKRPAIKKISGNRNVCEHCYQQRMKAIKK